MFIRDQIDDLYQEFNTSYLNFIDDIQLFINKAAKMNGTIGITEFCLEVLFNNRITVNEFILMINLGFDLTNSLYDAFGLVAQTSQIQLAKYILSTYAVDLNIARKDLEFKTTNMTIDMFQLIFPDHNFITNNIIADSALNIDKITLFISMGVDLRRIVDKIGGRTFFPNNYSEIGLFVLNAIVEKNCTDVFDTNPIYQMIIMLLRRGAIQKNLMENLVSAGLNPRYNNDILLSNACMANNNLDIVCYLIDCCNCDPNADNKKGSPIGCAIQENSSAVVKTLLERGVTIPNYVIVHCMHRPIYLPILYQYGVNIDDLATALVTYLLKHDKKIFETCCFLANSGIDLNLLFAKK